MTNAYDAGDVINITISGDLTEPGILATDALGNRTGNDAPNAGGGGAVTVDVGNTQSTGGITGNGHVQATDGVAELRAQLDAIQGRLTTETNRANQAEHQRDQAARVAHNATSRASEAQARILQSDADAIASGITEAKTESAAAKKALAQALQAGEYDAAGEAQERIAAAQARLVRLNEAQADLEIQRGEI